MALMRKTKMYMQENKMETTTTIAAKSLIKNSLGRTVYTVYVQMFFKYCSSFCYCLLLMRESET